MPRLGALLCLAIVLAASRAGASSADVFGLGPRASAQAGAVTATATDFSATYYNPAGLALSLTREVALGVLGSGSGLSIQGRRAGISDPLAVLVGARTPLPLGGALENRLFFGLAVSSLPDAIVRVVSHKPDEAFFPLYDNRTQRLLVLPAIAVRLTSRLGLGFGVDYLAGAAGAIQATTGASRALEPRVDEALGAAAAVHAGARWDPTRWLGLGLAYRQSFSVPIVEDAQVRVAGEPLNVVVTTNGLYAPDQVCGGISVKPRPGLSLNLDVTWARWSAWSGPYIQVKSTLPLAGEIEGELPRVPLRDIATFHVGIEQLAYRSARLEVHARGGYGFDPSPIPSRQEGVTNLMDGAKHLIAVGGGLRLSRGTRAITLDAHFGLQLVRERTYTKRVLAPGEAGLPFEALRDEVTDVSTDPATQGTQISNPGYPSIGGGGYVWAASLLLGVAL
jgi:hypothetical protein